MPFHKTGNSKRDGSAPRRSFDRDDRPPRSGERSSRAPAGRSFERKPSFGGKPFEKRPLELTTVICAKCGKETQVPFKPTGGKPVYCRDCFISGDESGPRKVYSPAPPALPSAEMREINEKLDKIMRALDIE